MSETCGNCDCASKSQCKKNGNTYGVEIVETEISYTTTETIVMDVGAAEHDSKCKCGTSCACVDCSCGN